MPIHNFPTSRRSGVFSLKKCIYFAYIFYICIFVLYKNKKLSFMEKFIEIINGVYSYEIKGKEIIINHQGNVYLDSLTTLPEGVKFENQGNVYLRSLTTLPEGVKFENKGYVYLRSLTTLPEGVKFENKGYVYLDSLTTMPDDLFVADGYGMQVNSKKKVGEFDIIDCNYLGNNHHSFVAKKGNYTAHGKTIREAIEDVNFKFLKDNFNQSEIVKNIKEKGTISINDYRLLTGACRQGVNGFLNQNNIDVSELPIKEALELTNGAYGYETIKELLS